MLRHKYIHRLLGHTIITRPVQKSDNCIGHTVIRGMIYPIMLDVCSCGQVW